MQYHPDTSLLEQHAAGSLPLAYSLCVSVHACFCPQCRRAITSLQGLGAVLMEQLPPQDVAAGTFERVMAAIDQFSDMQHDEANTGRHEAAASAVPVPLRGLIPEGYEQLHWSRLLPSLKVARLDLGDPRYSVALHQINAGGKVATHDHRGEEITLVLNGSFSDEFGVYTDGDFLLRVPNEVHRPRATENESCMCLTVQEAPVKFTGLFTRLINPLLR